MFLAIVRLYKVISRQKLLKRVLPPRGGGQQLKARYVKGAGNCQDIKLVVMVTGI